MQAVEESDMGPAHLVVVAIFTARPGREADLRAALRAMIEPTLQEAGCLNYDLHASNDEPGLFFFHETWTSAEAHRAHLDTAHVRNLLTLTPNLLAAPIRELKGTRLEA